MKLRSDWMYKKHCIVQWVLWLQVSQTNDLIEKDRQSNKEPHILPSKVTVSHTSPASLMKKLTQSGFTRCPLSLHQFQVPLWTCRIIQVPNVSLRPFWHYALPMTPLPCLPLDPYISPLLLKPLPSSDGLSLNLLLRKPSRQIWWPRQHQEVRGKAGRRPPSLNFWRTRCGGGKKLSSMNESVSWLVWEP